SPHEEAAATAFDAGDTATALTEFEAAYAETQRPDLLYVIGRLYAARDDCARAIEYFKRFLDTGPGPNATQGARKEIATCEATLAAKPQPPPPDVTPPPPDVTPPPSTTVDVTRTAPAPRPFWKDPAGDALVGGGVALGIAAVIVYSRARAAQCGDP